MRQAVPVATLVGRGRETPTPPVYSGTKLALLTLVRRRDEAGRRLLVGLGVGEIGDRVAFEERSGGSFPSDLRQQLAGVVELEIVRAPSSSRVVGSRRQRYCLQAVNQRKVYNQ